MPHIAAAIDVAGTNRADLLGPTACQPLETHHVAQHLGKIAEGSIDDRIRNRQNGSRFMCLGSSLANSCETPQRNIRFIRPACRLIVVRAQPRATIRAMTV